MPATQEQPDLMPVETGNEVDIKLQKRIEEIYTSGSTMSEFFEKSKEDQEDQEDQGEQSEEGGDLTLAHGMLLFHRK